MIEMNSNQNNLSVGASLDHAVWLHEPFRDDELLLFANESP
jgi:acyl-CoA thioesterase